MLISEKNSTYLYVGNVTNGYSDNDSVAFDTMPSGSLALIKADSRVAEEGALVSGQAYQIVAKTTNGELKVSPVFKSTDIINKSLKSYVASQEQVSFIGYNGTAIDGFGTLVAGNYYSLGFVLKHTTNMLNNTPEIKHVPYYAAVATQSVAAKVMQESFISMFRRTGGIKCDRVALTTSVAAITGSATIYKLTNGSKTVSTYTKATAGNTTLTASTASVTAADSIHIASYNARTFTFSAVALGTGAGRHLIWIGTTVYNVADAGTDAQNAAAIAAAINAGTQATASVDTAVVTVTYNDGQYYLPPMVLSSVDDSTYAAVAVTAASGDTIPVKYKAAATTSNADTFELDVAWQGPTGYLYEGTGATTTSSIGIATLTSDTWGLKFSGQPITKYNPKLDNWTKIEFDIFSDTFYALGRQEYKSVKASLGSGNYQQIQELENYTQGNDKVRYFADDMINTRVFDAVSGKYYDVFAINFKQTPYNSPTTGISPNNLFTIMLAIDKGLSYETLNTAFDVTAV